MWGPDISQDMIHTPKNPSFSSRRSTSQSVHYHTTQGYNHGGDIEYGRRWYMTYHLLEMCNAKDRSLISTVLSITTVMVSSGSAAE